MGQFLRALKTAKRTLLGDLAGAKPVWLLLAFAILIDVAWPWPEKSVWEIGEFSRRWLVFSLPLIGMGWFIWNAIRRSLQVFHKMPVEAWCYWVLVSLGFAITIFVLIFIQFDNSGWHEVLTKAIKSAGSVFAFVTGIASLIGLFVTYQSVRELGQNITSFEELAERVIRLVREAAADSDSDNVVRIVTYTPALGFFGLPENLWKSLNETLTNTIHAQIRCRVVCLKHTDYAYDAISDNPLADWHKLYEGIHSRRFGNAITSTEISAANHAASTFLRRIGTTNYRFAELSVIPDYYFFVTKDRAIVVSPLHLPLLALRRCSEQKANEIKIESHDLEMVGVETSDRRIVGGLRRLFDELWRNSDQDN